MNKTTLLISLLLWFSGFSQDLPEKNDIISNEKAAMKIYNSLQEACFPHLIEYYYREQITNPESRKKLYSLTSEALTRLKEVQENHKAVQERIEEYHHRTWDLKYGKNRLWRRSENLTNQIRYMLQDAKYLQALSLKGNARQAAADKVIEEVNQIEDSVPLSKLYLLKVKARYLKAGENEAFENRIFNDLEQSFVNTERNSLEHFETEIYRLRILRPFGNDELQRIISRYRDKGIFDYPDLSIQFAFLELEVGEGSLLLKLLKKWHGLTERISKIAFKKAKEMLANGELLEQVNSMSPVERELIIYSALINKSKNFDSFIIASAADVSYQSKVINYAAAAKLIGQNDEKAFDYATKAIKLKDNFKKMYPAITDLNIYTTAAAAGYETLKSGTEAEQERVIEIFDKYKELAGEDADEEISFLYAVQLKDKRPEESLATFKKTLESGGKYKTQARFEILVYKFENGETVLEEIREIYEMLERDDDPYFYADVIDLYSRSLAETGKLNEAAELLYDQLSYDITPTKECLNYVLQKYMTEAETYFEKAESRDTAEIHISEIARFIRRKYGDNMPDQVQLAYQEAIAISSSRGDLSMEEYSEQVTNGLSYNRVLARQLMNKTEYVEAAAIWGKIARSLASQGEFDPWRWSRAKFYQIKCGLSSPELSKEDKIHSFDVLESDPKWDNDFWKNKLKELKPDYVKEAQKQAEIERQKQRSTEPPEANPESPAEEKSENEQTGSENR
ncbi:hypothetical protein L21SP3_00760 [Sedimentisphaera cyanobacteriorum]|uniref:Tetratricopeptide repeat protein n=1 Tax=Sedimentisphaera cyanobacteriorum TaxID=1940790 RepID=A0A1Q2HNZ2_9BACT|nr:hypothetical protein [Sedimentisphaera cyanobacteriorum]AQQ08966.1 hypothetical protein L21SP3_00760 [Sedimentisphaera cyanobacteriorum]